MLAVKFNVVPSQIGLLLPAVGVAGIAFTVTTVVEGEELLQPVAVAFTEYVPDAAGVAFGIEGFC